MTDEVSLFAQLVVNGLVSGTVYAVLSLGFAFIYITTRTLHIAFGATYVFAALTFWVLKTQLLWPGAMAGIAAIIAGAVLGLLMEVIVYQPLFHRRASAPTVFLSSMGLYVVCISILSIGFGVETRILSSNVSAVHNLGIAVITTTQTTQFLIGGMVVALTCFLAVRTRPGKLIRAFRDEPELVQSLGVSPTRMRLLAFGTGSVLGSLAAVLNMLDAGVDPNSGLWSVFVAATAVIMGGMSTFAGAVLGGVLLGCLQGAALFVLASRWTEALTFAILVLFLLFRPQGLLGHRRRAEEIRD